MEIVMKKPTVPGAEKPGGERPPVYRGKPGPQGPAGTIEIAQVVTIEPSDPARVENIGDSTNAKLILYIPKGDPGNRGEPGPAVEITEDIIQAITSELDLTPELVGLGNVDNTSDMDKPVSNAQAAAIAQVQGDVGNHVADTNNPHGVTIAQIGAAPANHTEDTNNPHGVTVEQVGAVPADNLPNTFSRNLSVAPGRSIKFRISWHLLMVGRVMAAAGGSSAAVYALTGYNEYRAPIVKELSAGTGITVATGGDNDTGWYIEVTNNGVSTASLFLIGNCTPTII